MLFLSMILQFARCASTKFHRGDFARRLDISRRLRAGFVASRIGEDDDRELEALGAMHRHDAHTLGALLDDWRLARLVALGARFEFIDEGAKRRRPASRLVAPSLTPPSQQIAQLLPPAR